jgi:hypothetical protein
MIRRAAFTVIILTIPLLIFLPNIADFAYPMGSLYSDLAVSHYPNLVILRQSLAAGHGIPFWSHSILSGYPFAANPLAGIWYPPGWLLVLLPMPLGFNLLALIHMLWGGVGMYLLLRKREMSVLPALAGALAFQLFPKTLAHFAAGHITLLFAVVWTPWLLFAEHFQEHRPGRRFRLLPGFILGLILLADVRWGVYAGTLWLFYSLVTVFPEGYSGRAFVRWVKAAVSQIITAALIAAPLLLPMLEYARLSTRRTMTVEESLILPLPPTNLLGLIYPNLAGYAEWIIYPGALSLLFMLWIIFTPTLRERNRFWIAVVIISILVALGPGVPLVGALLKIIVRMPLLNLLRVPTRVVFLMGIALAVLLAEALQHMMSHQVANGAKKRFGPGLAVVGVTSFAILLSIGVYIVNGDAPVEFLWGALAFTIFCILILLRNAGRIPSKAWFYTLLPLLILDLFGTGYYQMRFRTPEDVLAEGKGSAEFLADQEGLFRVYSPSYSIPQQTAASLGLQLADGVDPMAMQTYTNFMDTATGVPRSGYSVTLPPMEGEDVHQANRNFTPDPKLLGLLNVKYVAAEFPMNDPGLSLIARYETTWIYENRFALPRAWIQDAADAVGMNILPLQNVNYQPNRISLNASGPGLLVLSEVYYPGWHVTINGKKGHIMPVMDLLRGVELVEAENSIVFTYTPGWTYIGLVLSALALILVFLSTRRVKQC